MLTKHVCLLKLCFDRNKVSYGGFHRETKQRADKSPTLTRPKNEFYKWETPFTLQTGFVRVELSQNQILKTLL